MPPRFLVDIKPQTVIPQSTVTFRGVFEGTPPFTVEWFKDGIRLIAGSSCTISLEKYSSSLELNSVEAMQTGVYSCQVSNEAGTVTNAAELLVKGWTILFLSSTIFHLTHLFSSFLPLFCLHSEQFIISQLYLCCL